MDWVKHLKVQLAVKQIARGEVIAYPTEAVWGLGCDPFNRHAVDHLLRLKQRPESKGLLLIAANRGQIQPFLHALNEEQIRQLDMVSEQPVTWLVPDGRIAPAWIRGHFDSVALRIINHPVASALCEQFGGPIVSTSANPSSRPPARNALTVRRYFPKGLAAIAPGCVGNADKPSEIRDLLSGDIIRKG